MNSSTHITIVLSRGWLATVAATGIGLVLGILYVWSVIKAGIPDTWGWTNADKALPYSVMAIVFSFSMVPAGRLQNTYGPRLMVFWGGFLAGLGCIIAGLGGDSIVAYIIGFGVFTGLGVGLGYAALTPTAIKWFPPQKTGQIVGIVVAGVGLAPVVLAPISAGLLSLFETSTAAGGVEKGISATMIALGIGIWLVVGGLFWFIIPPPLGFVAGPGSSAFQSHGQDMTWRQMLTTVQFWLLFTMFFSGASAGLVFISVAADLGRHALGEWAFLSIVVLSVGNSSGRLLAGIISDKIGRHWTLFAGFICQGAVVGLLLMLTRQGGGPWLIILVVVLMIGMNYGSIQTLFPATCRDYFGIRNFGINYGLLFTAFGTAGLIMPWLNGWIRDITGKPDLSYGLIIAMMAASAVLTIVSLRLGTPSAPSSKVLIHRGE